MCHGHQKCGYEDNIITQHPVCDVALTTGAGPWWEAACLKVSVSKNVAFNQTCQQSKQHPHNCRCTENCTVTLINRNKLKDISLKIILSKLFSHDKNLLPLIRILLNEMMLCKQDSRLFRYIWVELSNDSEIGAIHYQDDDFSVINRSHLFNFQNCQYHICLCIIVKAWEYW